MKNRILGITAALISSGTFGLIPLFTIPLITVYGMGEFSVLFYRYLIGTLAIGAMCSYSGKSPRVPLRTMGKLFVLSLLYAGTGIALIYSYNYISSGVVTTIHFLYPVIVALLMVFFYREKLSRNLVLAALATLAGVSVLCWTGSGTLDMRGILLALSTAVTYAFYIAGLKMKGIRVLDSRQIVFWLMLFGMGLFFLMAIATGGLQAVPSAGAGLNILLLALVPTIISNIALVKAVEYAGATTASILGSAEPVVAVLLGITVFSEHFTVRSFLGLVIIVAAVTWVVMTQARPRPSGDYSARVS